MGPTERERPKKQNQNLWNVQDSEEKEGWTSLTYRRPLAAPKGNSNAKSIVVSNYCTEKSLTRNLSIIKQDRNCGIGPMEEHCLSNVTVDR